MIRMSILCLCFSLYIQANDKDYESKIIEQLNSSKDKETILNCYKYLANSNSNNKELWKALEKNLKDLATVRIFLKGRGHKKPPAPSNFYDGEDSYYDYFILLKTLAEGKSDKVIDTFDSLRKTKFSPNYNHKLATERLFLAALRFRNNPSEKVISFLKKYLLVDDNQTITNISILTLASYGIKESAELLTINHFYAINQYRHKLENTKAMYRIYIEGQIISGDHSIYDFFLSEEVYSYGTNKMIKATPYSPKNKKEADEFIELFNKLIKGYKKLKPSANEIKQFEQIIKDINVLKLKLKH